MSKSEAASLLHELAVEFRRGHRRSREAKGKQAKVATCMTCPEKEKVAENMIFCRKYQFGVFVNLAQTTRVCEDFKEGDVHG